MHLRSLSRGNVKRAVAVLVLKVGVEATAVNHGICTTDCRLLFRCEVRLNGINLSCEWNEADFQLFALLGKCGEDAFRVIRVHESRASSGRHAVCVRTENHDVS